VPVSSLPKGLLCDMDDTILNSSGARERCWREAFVEAAGRLGELEWAAFIEAITRTERWFWTDPERHLRGRMDLLGACRETTHAALVELGIDRLDLAGALADRYRELREERFRVFPGALETLEHLRVEGVRLAMMTNGAAVDQRRKIDRFGLGRYFDRVLIEGELGVGKPHPQVYTIALEALACRPEEAWSIGDNLEWDVVVAPTAWHLRDLDRRTGRGLAGGVRRAAGSYRPVDHRPALAAGPRRRGRIEVPPALHSKRSCAAQAHTCSPRGG
jgi:putative hydrolase of the HAD superfamily